MIKNQKGFTLIELVMVIVILGILAAVAIPKYINLKADAQAAALLGVAGSISGASAINFGARSANVVNGVATTGGGITCATAAAAVMEGGIPAGYASSVAATVPLANTCILTQTDGGATANFTILGIL